MTPARFPICTTAAMSSARSTTIGTWSPRTVGRRVARTLALNYGLAPEYPFRGTVEVALSGYRFLSSAGFRPGRVAIAGDSLVVAATVAIRDWRLPQPCCSWCVSPWVDMEATGETVSTNAAAARLLVRVSIRAFGGL